MSWNSSVNQMDAILSGRGFKEIGCKCYRSSCMIERRKWGSATCKRIIGFLDIAWCSLKMEYDVGASGHFFLLSFFGV
jgi:hypothetical protein